jgi:hypothetical protein
MGRKPPDKRIFPRLPSPILRAVGSPGWHGPCFSKDMKIAPVGAGTRTGSRDEETTRVFHRPMLLPAPSEPLAPMEFPKPKPELYFHAPSPWPRGRFQIDPEA